MCSTFAIILLPFINDMFNNIVAYNLGNNIIANIQDCISIVYNICYLELYCSILLKCNQYVIHNDNNIRMK